MQPEPREPFVDADAGAGQRGCVPGQPLPRGVHVRGDVADQGDSSVPGGEQVLDGETSADLVLEEHGVGSQAHRRAVEEHHGHPMFDLPLEELVILAGTGDQQPVDPSSDEAVDDLALAARIVVGAHGDQQVTFGEGRILDEPGDRRVERVRHVGDDEADRRRPGRPPQGARPVVAAVAERAHRRLHPGIDLIADEWLLVRRRGRPS